MTRNTSCIGRALASVAVILVALSAMAQTPVSFPVRQLTGGDELRQMTLTPLDGTVLWNGTYYTPTQLVVQPVPNGATNLLGQLCPGVITNLIGGNWRFTFQGLSSAGQIYVPFGFTNGINAADPQYARKGIVQFLNFFFTNGPLTGITAQQATNITLALIGTSTNGITATVATNIATAVANGLGFITAPTGTNIAAYQAFLATNGILNGLPFGATGSGIATLTTNNHILNVDVSTLAGETNSGLMSTNSIAYSERTVENRQANGRIPVLGFEPWQFRGANMAEADYLTIANIVYTNALSAYGWRWIDINDGWPSGRDGGGNIVADATKFPHGLQFLASALHTNGMFAFIYEEPRATTSGGFTGSAGHIGQDAATFVSWGFDGVRFDYPESLGTAGHNSRFLYFANQMDSALEQNAKRPPFSYHSGWQTNDLITGPGAGDVWQHAGSDISIDGTSMAQAWTNVLSHFYAKLPYAQQGGQGHIMNLGYCPIVVGVGPPSLWAMVASPIFVPRAYGPGDAGILGQVSPFTIETNGLWLSIVQDPAVVPGYLAWSNSTGALVVRQLSGNKRAVCLINNLTNASSTVGFSGADIGFGPVALNLQDVWNQTNAFSVISSTSSVPSCSAMLFIAAPAGPGLRFDLVASGANSGQTLRVDSGSTLYPTNGGKIIATLATNVPSGGMIGNLAVLTNGLSDGEFIGPNGIAPMLDLNSVLGPNGTILISGDLSIQAGRFTNTSWSTSGILTNDSRGNVGTTPSLGFDRLGSGASAGQALRVDAGSALYPTNGGTITATTAAAATQATNVVAGGSIGNLLISTNTTSTQIGSLPALLSDSSRGASGTFLIGGDLSILSGGSFTNVSWTAAGVLTNSSTGRVGTTPYLPALFMATNFLAAAGTNINLVTNWNNGVVTVTISGNTSPISSNGVVLALGYNPQASSMNLSNFAGLSDALGALTNNGGKTFGWYDYAALILSATNQQAIANTNQWDPKGAALTATNQLAIANTNQWDPIGAALTATNQLARANTNLWDPIGAALTATNQLAKANTNQWDPINSALIATNQLAIANTNQWDPKGAALTATNQLAIANTNQWDPIGAALTATNQLAIANTNRWDPLGAALTATNQLAIANTNRWQPKLPTAPADGWTLISSNGVWIASLNAGALTNGAGGGGVTTFDQLGGGISTFQTFTIGNSSKMVPAGTGIIVANTVTGTQTNNTTGNATTATWATNVPSGGKIGLMNVTILPSQAGSRLLATNADLTFVEAPTAYLATGAPFYFTGASNWMQGNLAIGGTLYVASMNVADEWVTNFHGLFGDTNLANTGSAGLYLGWVSASNHLAWLPINIASNLVNHFGVVDTNDTTHNYEVLLGGGIFESNAVTGAWGMITNDSVTLSNLQGAYLTYTNLALTLTNRTTANMGSQLTTSNLTIITGYAGSNTLYDANGTSVIMTLTNGGGFFLNDLRASFFRGDQLVTRAYWNTNNFPFTAGAINVDFRGGYQFISTNASFTVAGFINATNNVVNQVWVSVSNSAASSITMTWPGAPLRNFGTNTATSGPISAGKVWKGLFQVDPHGTNLIWPLMQNN